MASRSSDLQLDSDLDSIRNSCDVLGTIKNYSRDTITCLTLGLSSLMFISSCLDLIEDDGLSPIPSPILNPFKLTLQQKSSFQY